MLGQVYFSNHHLVLYAQVRPYSLKAFVVLQMRHHYQKTCDKIRRIRRR